MGGMWAFVAGSMSRHGPRLDPDCPYVRRKIALERRQVSENFTDLVTAALEKSPSRCLAFPLGARRWLRQAPRGRASQAASVSCVRALIGGYRGANFSSTCLPVPRRLGWLRVRSRPCSREFCRRIIKGQASYSHHQRRVPGTMQPAQVGHGSAEAEDGGGAVSR